MLSDQRRDELTATTMHMNRMLLAAIDFRATRPDTKESDDAWQVLTRIGRERPNCPEDCPDYWRMGVLALALECAHYSRADAAAIAAIDTRILDLLARLEGDER